MGVKNICRREFECTSCKDTFKFFFSPCFWLVYSFFLRVNACTWHIEWFAWHQEPKRPQWPQQPQWPRWPQWPHQHHFIKKLTEHDAAINLAIELPILVSQCGMDYQKPINIWTFGTFSVGGCGGHGCNFQPNPRVINQMSASHECTDMFFMTLKCIFDGLISVLFRAYRV